MTLLAQRIVAGVLAVSAAYVGLWAQLAPRSFYDDFPLPGHPWVSSEGPFNEHLVRDVGGLYLALFGLTAWAVLRPVATLVAAVGLGWELFSVPHLAFHLHHLGGMARMDQVGNVVSLGGTVVLAGLLLVPARNT
jgi:hypothetical protein